MVARAFPFLSALIIASGVLMLSAPSSGASLTVAQLKVQTETIRPDDQAVTDQADTAKPAGDQPGAQTPGAANPFADSDNAGAADIERDPSKLPSAVAATREKLLAAARAGDISILAAIIKSSDPTPVFTFSDASDPAAYWKENYPDSDGIEVLSILISILESGYVHVDQGSPQEMYVWPYFARMPLRKLTPEQKVELFRIVTGADYKQMLDFGAYIFYRVGIAPDGTWHFFVAGD